MHPIIHLNPNGLPCGCSTPVYVAKETDKLNIKTQALTFDQPLLFKAVNIVGEYKLNIVFPHEGELPWQYQNFDGWVWSY